MAKFDVFIITEDFTVDGKAHSASLTALFENGDNTSQVMDTAYTAISSHVADVQAKGTVKPTVTSAVKYLESFTKEQVRDVCREYWIKQMRQLGASKIAYGDQLRQDIITAQNSSN
jgi:hypothetical protein